jgi:L-fuconolactonase
LLRDRDIPAATETAQALPELSFVVDHIAKPRVMDGSGPAWEAGMPGLAALENVAQEVEPVRGRLEGAMKG